jgi:hypothetical protein
LGYIDLETNHLKELMIVYHDVEEDFVISQVFLPMSLWESMPVYFVDQRIKGTTYKNINACTSLEEAEIYVVKTYTYLKEKQG